MTTQEIRDLIEDLRNREDIQEAGWTLAGNTKYEITLDGVDMVFDRYNSIDRNRPECYIKVGEFEGIYGPDTEEFEMITDFVTWL